ncbi:MAG TPA: hypothetical protein VM261_22270 [Kofleriaceae bacterium]|nr:hypothetical protein [Kofleriaceae bacterium]
MTRMLVFLVWVGLELGLGGLLLGGCGKSAPGRGWQAASRDRGAAARIDQDIAKLDGATAKKMRETLDAMAATPRTPEGVRAAAALAVGAKLVPPDWSGSGTHPAWSVFHEASLNLMAGLVAGAAKQELADGRQPGEGVTLLDAVEEMPLVQVYNSGGPIPDSSDRARLLGEVELAYGKQFMEALARNPPPGPNGAQPQGAATGSAQLMGKPVSGNPVDLCNPVEPQQRAATAQVQLSGDVTNAPVDLPAICGAFHTVKTNRFEVGDGTLFRACFPDGSTLSISSDVVIAGKVKPLFVVKDYKKTGPLVELNRAGVGTYNQRDEPTDADQLDIAFDWSKVMLSIDLPWPSKLDRVVHVEATFDCGGPLRENTWAP